MQHIKLAAALCAAISANALANTPPQLPAAEFTLEEIVVTATRLPMLDFTAPYASEVHTRRTIERSGAATLYDYLAQQSSVQILPSYGNRATPKIDMRGYGIGDGYQNIVVTVDGRRMNNIDMAPQLLGAISLTDIERIEITKGSGSVMFGDGATAGSIQIVTRQHDGVSLQASAGNFGARHAMVTAGRKSEKLNVGVSAEYSHLDGTSDADVTGHKDASSNRTWRGNLEFRPAGRLKLGLDLASTRIDTRYVGSITQAEFDANPKQNSGNAYTHQKFESETWRILANMELNKNFNITANHSREDKLSQYSSGWKSDYDYSADDLALQYRGGDFTLTTGVQTFDGIRIGSDSHTDKKNTGFYTQGQYRLGVTTLSAGARRENVEYTYAPTSGSALNADHDLNAWDIGVNHQLNERLSLFSNYNSAFQAPDIDRFFNWGGAFNGFISPAKSRTLNIGLNHATPVNRLKLTVFRTNLNNEIYYYKTGAWSGRNTNLDKTHKYGLELQDAWRVSEAFSVNLNYAWTRAIIDRENEGGGAYNGKALPGVPKHGVTLGLAWQANTATSLNLTHAWRSSTWAEEDFDNNNAQKQAAYESTDVVLRYRKGDIEWFAAIDNLFERKNGLWIQDDAIYPVNFTRNWRLGMKVAF